MAGINPAYSALLPDSDPMADQATSYDNSESNPRGISVQMAHLPRIPLDLRQHKIAIAIPFTLVILTAGIIPIIGYLTVHYLTTASLTVSMTPFLALFGVTTLYSLGTRTYSLLRKDSTTRPVGQTNRWAMDYYEWNLLVGFVGITILISVSISDKLVRVASLPLSIILGYAGAELFLGAIAHHFKIASPFRISSTAKGEPMRSGVLAIAEDIVAVDGRQGTEFRRLLMARYDASPPIQRLCFRLDLLWGIGGICVFAAVCGVAFGVSNSSVGWGVGWGVPWVFAGIATIITIQMVKAAKREEQRYFSKPLGNHA